MFWWPPWVPANRDVLRNAALGVGILKLIFLLSHSIGYAPYAAGLYTKSRYDVDWLLLFGAALCGISAGVFWMAEAAIAIAYPEPWNKGKALGYWLTYRLSGQIIGGAVNLGLNADRNTAGQVSYTVYSPYYSSPFTDSRL